MLEGSIKLNKKRLKLAKGLGKHGSFFNKCLGEHFMTAVCLKHFGDFLFFENETDALSHYQQALEMMKNLGLDGRKESIMTLKNYGVCLKNKGNFEEARNLLEMPRGN